MVIPDHLILPSFPQYIKDIADDINTPCNSTSQNNSASQNKLAMIFNYFVIALTLFLAIYAAMNSSEVTGKSKVESPMFCFCYGETEIPEIKKMRLDGQKIIPDDRQK